MASSSTILVPISKLPTTISLNEAFSAAYQEQIQDICKQMSRGLNVLVRLPKAVWETAYAVLRNEYKRYCKALPGEEKPKKLRLLVGREAQPDESTLGAMLLEFKTAVQHGGAGQEDSDNAGLENEILVLPHLDILTTTTKSSLTSDTREMLIASYLNSKATILAFCDPQFTIPTVLEGLFNKSVCLSGINRDTIAKMVTQAEARKFAVKHWNPYDLHKVVSGMHPNGFRQMMQSFSKHEDYNPENPSTAEELFKQIREMTTSDGVTIPKVNLRSDIGGYEEVKDQLESEILEILKYKDSLTDPAEIKRIEQIIPRGMLLHGPPGTGKTYFCKGIATELNAALFVVNGPELKSKWVGESEQNIRDVFRKAKENAPALIVFDEIDSFAGQRGGLNNGASQSMVNQLLTEMDGFTKEELVFVVATTNFVESVDSALLRPGRFELKIKIDNPNEYDRGEIIDVYIEKFGLDISDEIRDYIVERTGGFSDMMTGARYTGDHLYAIMRNLMRQDIRARGELVIDRAAIDKAMSKGTKKKADFTQGELRTVTIHEGGHAILSHYLAHSTPTEKISTKSDIPGSLGYVRRGEREEKYIMTEAQMTDDICVLLGGREAERMYIGDVSAGAQDDLQRATMLARAMVEELGMGTGIRVTAGFQVHGRDSKRADISDHQAAEIDKQVEGILQAQKERAVKILKERKKEMKALVKALRKDRVIEKEQIIEILGDPVVAKKPSEDDDWIV